MNNEMSASDALCGAAAAHCPPSRASGHYDLRRSLKRKALALGLVLLAGGVAAALVRHYFWALNAQIYTVEFNLMFILNRLKDGDLAMCIEYLRPMGLARGFSSLLFADLAQIRFPSAHDVMTPAAAALGARGYFLGWGALLTCTAIWSALGRFALGDLLPALRLRRGEAHPAQPPHPAALAVAFLAALPWLPLAPAALAAGALRLPVRLLLPVLGSAVLLRMVFALNTGL